MKFYLFQFYFDLSLFRAFVIAFVIFAFGFFRVESAALRAQQVIGCVTFWLSCLERES